MRITALSVFFGIVAAIVSGCAGVTVNTEALAKIKKVAIIGVYTKRLPEAEATEVNNKALQKVLEDSSAVLADELKTACGWDVQSLASVRDTGAYKAFSDSVSANPVYSKWLGGYNERYIGPDSVLIVHKAYLMDPGKEVSGDEQVVMDGVKELCAALNVDAVIILKISQFIGNTTGFRVSVGKGRTYGFIKYNPELAIMDKNAVPVISLGSDNLDDLAPTKHNVPIYKGNANDSFSLDLEHEDVYKAFGILEKKTLSGLARKIKKTMVP